MLQTLEVSHQSLSGWGRHGAVTKPAFFWPRVRPTPAGQPKPSHALLLSTSPRSWASALRFSSASPSKTVLLVATSLVLALVFCPLSQTTTKSAFTGLQECARARRRQISTQSKLCAQDRNALRCKRKTNVSVETLGHPREREGARKLHSTVTAQLPRGLTTLPR